MSPPLLMASLLASSIRNEERPPVRWGVMGTGAVAEDFSRVLLALPTAQLAAVGSRSEQKAQSFLRKVGAGEVGAVAHGSYESLLADENVDIVYVATPSARHVSDSLACLENGKAVLCEKSMAPSASEASRVLDLATSRRLFFLHGVWSRFFPAYAEIRRLIESGAIGQVCSVHASFCQRDGAGACSAMAETGVYCAQFLLWVYGGVAPRVVGVSYTLDEDTGLDTHVSAALEWPCGGKGTFECSLRHPSPRGATICGTKGVIEVPFPFWCPTSITVQTMTGRGSQTFGEKTVLSFPLPKVNDADQLNFVNSQGLFYEAAAATQCMLDGAIETTQFSSSECLLVMQLVSDIRAHWMT